MHEQHDRSHEHVVDSLCTKEARRRKVNAVDGRWSVVTRGGNSVTCGLTLDRLLTENDDNLRLNWCTWRLRGGADQFLPFRNGLGGFYFPSGMVFAAFAGVCLGPLNIPDVSV